MNKSIWAKMARGADSKQRAAFYTGRSVNFAAFTVKKIFDFLDFSPIFFVFFSTE